MLPIPVLTAEMMPDSTSASATMLGEMPAAEKVRSSKLRTTFGRLGRIKASVASLSNETEMALPGSGGPFGAGSTIFNLGDRPGFSLDDFAEPVLIEPTFYLTGCLIWSNEFPLTLAAERVKTLLIDFLKHHIQGSNRPGASWLD